MITTQSYYPEFTRFSPTAKGSSNKEQSLKQLLGDYKTGITTIQKAKTERKIKVLAKGS